MLYQTIWYSICLLFFFSGLFDLFQSKNKVFFKSDFHRSDIRDLKVSVCFELDSSAYNCSNLDGKSWEACKSLKNYLNYVGDKKPKSPQTIIEKFDEFAIPPLFEIGKAEEERKYLNLANLCTLYRLEIAVKETEDYLTIKIRNHFNITTILFVHNEKIIFRYQRFEHLLCENFRSCRYFTLTTRRFRRTLLPAPYETDCLNYSERSFPFRGVERIDSQTAAMQECLKSKQRLPEFFYTESDSDLLEFNSSGNYHLLDAKHVEHCRVQCRKEACDYRSFIFLELDYKAQDHVKIQISTTQASFEAIPLMDSYGFLRTFLSFITLFFRVSLLSLVLKANNALFRLSTGHSKYRYERKLITSIARIFLWLLFICTLFYGSFLARMVYDKYKDKHLTSFFEASLPVVPVNFSIALCKKLDTQTEGLNLLELAKSAKVFNTTENFFVTFGKNQDKLNFLNDRFFFKSTNQSHLEHCFSTDVHIQEQRYKSLLSLSTLVVQTNVSFDSILLEQMNRTFTGKSFTLTRNREIVTLEKNSESDCEDYHRNQTVGEERCDSQQGCIEKCYNKKFLDKFLKLPSKSLVHLNDYKEPRKHWLFFDYEHPNEDAFLDECEEKFKKPDCKSITFISHERMDFDSDNEIQISPFFLQLKQYNVLDFNLFQLICNLVQLSTIILALNWPKLSNTAVELINHLLKPEDKLNLRNVFFLLSFAGFIAHAIYIFREICLSDLQVSSNYYFDFLSPNFDMPDLVFCLETQAKFEKNEVITGRLLKEKTRWLDESYLFEEILYYDLDMKLKIWKPGATFSDNLQIWPWFLLNFKCFTVHYSIDNRHPLNYVINSIIRFKFNSKMQNHTSCLFTSKKKQTNDMSNYFFVNFTALSRVHYVYFETSYYNKYQTLINPKLWFSSGYPINVSV